MSATDAPSEPGDDSAAAARRVSRWDRPPPPHDWRWAVGGVGRVLIALGLLMFGFVAYQLWGTGIQTAQAQRSLSRDFDRQIAAIGTNTTTTTAAATTTTTIAASSSTSIVPATDVTTTTVPTTGLAPARPVPAIGDAVAKLEIPRIGLDTSRRRRCPASSATPPSPGTAPPTCTRSTTSTGCSPATRSPSPP
jgi:hypothetical protein